MSYEFCFSVHLHFNIIFGINIEQGTPLVDCTFETKPLKVRADYALTLKVEPIEATYDSVSINKYV